MRDGDQSLDLVVRSDSGISLTLGGEEIAENRLVLVGTLIDPEARPRVDTTVEVEIAPELGGGTHIDRVTEWMFEIDGTEIPFSWEVERHELGDGYVLRDARVHSDAGGELRAFAIEDIAASVGIGIAAAAGVVFGWRVLRERRAAAEARRLWDDCIARGGSPSWSYDVVDEVGVEVGVEGPGLRITSGAKPSVRCDMSSAAR